MRDSRRTRRTNACPPTGLGGRHCMHVMRCEIAGITEAPMHQDGVAVHYWEASRRHGTSKERRKNRPPISQKRTSWLDGPEGAPARTISRYVKRPYARVTPYTHTRKEITERPTPLFMQRGSVCAPARTVSSVLAHYIIYMA